MIEAPSVLTADQARDVNRLQKVAALYSYMDTCVRSGNPQEITHDSNNQQFRTWAEDKPFSLVFDARGVYGLYIMRRGLRRSLEGQGLGILAEEIIRSYNEGPQDKAPDRDLRQHIANTGGY